MTPFQIIGLDHAQFEPIFELSDEQLGQLGAERCIATSNSGFPCRVSLRDAAEGDELLLIPFVHQPCASPYRASGPVFVRRGARKRVLGENDMPDYVTTRLMSLRAYDARHMMIDACVCEGGMARGELGRLLDNERIAYIHLHNAKRGCFSCRVERA